MTVLEDELYFLMNNWHIPYGDIMGMPSSRRKRMSETLYLKLQSGKQQQQ